MSLSRSPQDFAPKSEADNVKSFADLMPLNKLLWIGMRIPDSNAYKLLKVLAQDLARFQLLEYAVANQYIPNETNSFIEQWEEMLGIPDSCFPNTGTDEERRRNILIKLNYMNLQTAQDYEELGAILGLNVQVQPNVPADPWVWTINIDAADPNVFPYTFPFTFTENFIELFVCLTQKQKPAHTELLYSFIPNVYVTNDDDVYVTNDDDAYIDGGTF